MTSDTERIAALESQYEAQTKWMQSMAGDIKELRDALNMGKGALYVILKVGVSLAALAGFVAWFTDHLKIGLR